MKRKLLFLGEICLTILLLTTCLLPAVGARQIDVYLYQYQRGQQPAYAVKAHESQSNKWARLEVQIKGTKFEVSPPKESESFQEMFLGKHYVKPQVNVPAMQEVIALQDFLQIKPPDNDGNWGPGTWKTLLKYFTSQAKTLETPISIKSPLDVTLTLKSVNRTLENLSPKTLPSSAEAQLLATFAFEDTTKSLDLLKTASDIKGFSPETQKALFDAINNRLHPQRAVAPRTVVVVVFHLYNADKKEHRAVLKRVANEKSNSAPVQVTLTWKEQSSMKEDGESVKFLWKLLLGENEPTADSLNTLQKAMGISTKVQSWSEGLKYFVSFLEQQSKEQKDYKVDTFKDAFGVTLEVQNVNRYILEAAKAADNAAMEESLRPVGKLNEYIADIQDLARVLSKEGQGTDAELGTPSVKQLVELVKILDANKIPTTNTAIESLFKTYLEQNKKQLPRGRVLAQFSAPEPSSWGAFVKKQYPPNWLFWALIGGAIVVLAGGAFAGYKFWSLPHRARQTARPREEFDTEYNLQETVSEEVVTPLEDRIASASTQQATRRSLSGAEIITARYPQLAEYEKQRKAPKAKEPQAPPTLSPEQYSELVAKIEQEVQERLEERVVSQVEQRVQEEVTACVRPEVEQQVRLIKSEFGTALKELNETMGQYVAQFGNAYSKAAEGAIQLVEKLSERAKEWGVLLDKTNLEQLLQEHLHFEEILNSSQQNLTHYLDSFASRMPEPQKNLEQIAKLVNKIDQQVDGILSNAQKIPRFNASKFNALTTSLKHFHEEIEEANAVYKPLEPMTIESYLNYRQRVEAQSKPENRLYAEYLQTISQQFNNYFQKAIGKLGQSILAVSRPEDYFPEQLESLVTQGIIPFVYVLDDELKNAGYDTGDSPLEPSLQSLLRLTGLEEIPAAAGAKYDANLHEAVRWERPETSGNEGRLISLVRRGFRVDGKIERRARVVVYQ